MLYLLLRPLALGDVLHGTLEAYCPALVIPDNPRIQRDPYVAAVPAASQNLKPRQSPLFLQQAYYLYSLGRIGAEVVTDIRDIRYHLFRRTVVERTDKHGVYRKQAPLYRGLEDALSSVLKDAAVLLFGP